MHFYTNVYQYGNSLLVRGVKDGKGYATKIAYKPTLFLNAKKLSETGYKTLSGNSVEPMVFSCIKEAKEFIEKYKDIQGFEIHGIRTFANQYISDNFKGEIEWDFSKIRVFYLDIEVEAKNGWPNIETANNPITAITLYDTFTKRYYVWGRKTYVPTMDNVEYNLCETEEILLEHFVEFWSKNYPDVVTGWNVRFFDIAYIVNRIGRIFDQRQINKLSPWGICYNRDISIQKRVNRTYELAGISIMDYLELYKKYTYVSKESFKLHYIAKIELGEGKVEFSGTLQELYEENYQKFIDYNIKDVELVKRLDEKMRFIELVIGMSYIAKVSDYNKTYGPVHYWEIMVYNFLIERNIVISEVEQGSKSTQYEGAYVKDPIIGKHDWVVSFDLNSLYPNVARQWNIGPETHIPYNQLPVELKEIADKVTIDELIDGTFDLSALRKHDVTMTANRQFYHRKHMSFFSEIFGKLYDARVQVKKEMLRLQQEKENTKDKNEQQKLDYTIAALHNKQLAAKVSLNSAYGAIGNAFFRYYSVDNAEGITVTGQLVDRWIEIRVNKRLNTLLKTSGVNYVVASDTDSIYVVLDKLVSSVLPKTKDIDNNTYTTKVINFMDRFCKVDLVPFIAKCCQELFEYTNSYLPLMEMKRESLASRGIWTGKKHYLMYVYDSEGVRYSKPKLKITGIEAVKSSTPEICREKIREALEIIVTKDEDAVISFVENFRTEFRKLPAEIIGFPRGINDLRAYADLRGLPTKGAPIHVKSALMYNKLLIDTGVVSKFPMVEDGNKIKFVYLKTPNPIRNNAIAFVDDLPKEFNLHKYIDYDLQFEKAFVNPIIAVLDAIGWKLEKTGDLTTLFG